MFGSRSWSIFAAICLTPAEVYLVPKSLPNIALSVEFVRAAWIVLTEASPVPSVALVERLLMGIRCVPQGVRRWVMFAVELAEVVAVERKGVLFPEIPLTAALTCSGRKK